jgi:subtilase family serine protease
VVVDERGRPKAAAVPSGAYGPAQFRGAYNLPSTSAGSGQTIGIVDAYDDPNIESDLGVYSRQFALPSCTTANGCFKRSIRLGGPNTGKECGWSLEIALDVEIAHAVCPNCKILLVEATSNSFSNLLAAEDYAKAHATVVSNSWGGGEFSGESSYDAHFSTANKPITFSSAIAGNGVEYPAASQYVTAVGGTTLLVNADNSYQSEAVWSGAGSGCSALEPKPTWQKDSGAYAAQFADVSADADRNTGAAVYDSVRYQGRSDGFR